VATGTRFNTGTATRPFEYGILADVTTIDTSVAATDYHAFWYKVEGLDTANLNFGETDAKSITLSFWHAHTKTGTHSISFRNLAANRSYVVEYTQSVSNTWESSSVTVAGDTTGTWPKDNTLGLSIFFAMMTGSTFAGTAGSWAAANYLGSTNQVNNFDSASNFFRIGNVKLEEGTAATTFYPRPYAEEEAMCQRYYEAVSLGSGHRIMFRGDTTNNAFYIGKADFAVIKRTTPTMTVTNSNVNGFPTAIGTIGVDTGGVSEQKQANTTAGGRFFYSNWIADAEL